MKILLVSNMYPDKKHPSYGIFVKRFANELEKLGICYDCSVMHQKNCKIEKVVGYVKFYCRTFIKVLTGTYDVIYIHYASHSSIPILAVSRFKKLNIYTNVHGSDVVPINEHQEKMQKYTKAILNKSQKVIVPSEFFKEYVSNKYDIATNVITIYPSGGIDKNVFFPMCKKEIEYIRKQYGIDNELITFGMAGRLIERKGWKFFVKAIKLLNDRGIKANFMIAGSGPDEDKLDKLINECGLKNIIKRIELLPQKELCKFYNIVDYFVFPSSLSESLGLVAIEAMACGTPVIASNFAAPKYYIQNGVNGYKFEKGNIEELADVMARCIENQNPDLQGKAFDYKNNMTYSIMRAKALETAEKYDNNHIRRILKNLFTHGDS